jgi:serine/threonine-protein kinase
MGLIKGYKVKKAINTILSSPDATSPEVIDATLKLKAIGHASIPQLIERLETTHNPEPLENLLIGFLDDATLHYYIEELSNDNKHVVSSLTNVLSKSSRFNPNQLLDLFQDPDISKSSLGSIISAHKDKLSHKKLLNLLEKVPTNTRSTIYQVIQNLATASLIPDLIFKLKSDDAGIRSRIAQILSRFSTIETRDALVELLEDSNKNVRQSALESLARLKIPVPSKPICALLSDPDVMVQSKAIETLIEIKDANTVKYLIDILQDEDEYVRRSAVEVLNEVGDQRAIKDLLNALRDSDWWVKVRAADALGTIGGPKVVEAVLPLIKDDDLFMRRTAVEILNNSKDDRAFNSLIEALKDEDWWVKERAADALALLGDKRAAAPLRELMKQGPQESQVAIRALAAIDDKESIIPLIKQLDSKDKSVRREALRALQKLTDKRHAETVQIAVSKLQGSNDREIQNLATQTINMISSSEETDEIEKTQLIDNRSSMLDNAEPMFNLDGEDESVTAESAPPQITDVSRLSPGMLLGDRYRIIKKIGKGAFGVVMLVEDEAINDQLIMKFLNPKDAADKNLVQRFIHELRYARKTTHENVIRIYDFITIGDIYAISMEYFPSHSLADEMSSKNPMEIHRAIKIICDISEGMSAAQAANVVHRDLKPANILINDADMVKIVDFGIAAAASQADTRITKHGVLVGTPTYMSPEQAHGRMLDSRTDIYSLGIIMYELFTGRPPYEGDYPMATLFKHIEGKARPPRELNPDLPEELEKIIMKAIAVEPAERYQNFKELKDSLIELEKVLN